MTAQRYILSIDLGTGGPKVALVSETGDVAAAAVRPIQMHRTPPLAAEQDPEEMWSAVLAAARHVVREAGQAAESIIAVTCTSQYFSIVPIDRDGVPVGNSISWMDGRGGPYALQIYQEHPDAFDRWVNVAGMPPLPTGNDSVSHVLFLKNERPEIYARAYKFVEPMDYITTRLCGVCAANPCTAFAQLLTDNRDLGAVHYDDDLLRWSGIDREKLPDLVPVNACIGTVRSPVAAEIGLSPQTKVFSGTNDTQAVSIGTGTSRAGHGGINIGTTCQVLSFTEGMRADLAHGILSMPAPIAGRRMVMAENGLGGKTLECFLGNVVFAGDALADHASATPFANVEMTLRATPPGSDGVLFLPWLDGANYPLPNPTMRGGFLNLSLETTRAHLLRAVVEGVTFSLRWLLPAVEDFSGQQFGELYFAGGGAVSDQWSQALADVMQRPVFQMAEPRHVNNRATAFLAFEQLGLQSFDNLHLFCPVQHRYDARREQRDLYDLMFGQFQAAFEQNRPIFEALNAGRMAT